MVVQDESVERPGPVTRHIAQQEAEDDLKPQRSAPGQQPRTIFLNVNSTPHTSPFSRVCAHL